MPSFSKESLKKLSTCCPELQMIFKEVVKTYDCVILCGFRGQKDQNEAFRTGVSKVQWPNGEHNKTPSEAVDVAPYPLDWNDTRRFYHFAGFVQATAESMGYKLRWGGDWDSDRDLKDQSFFDLPHFELEGKL